VFTTAKPGPTERGWLIYAPLWSVNVLASKGRCDVVFPV
jgi:hypothetical protein